jgi:hypothetical protein
MAANIDIAFMVVSLNDCVKIPLLTVRIQILTFFYSDSGEDDQLIIGKRTSLEERYQKSKFECESSDH